MSTRPILPRRALVLGGCAAALGAVRPLLAQEAGVSDNLVAFGHTGILSGPLGGPVKTLLAGAKLALDAANARGGVAGRRIEIVSRDDELVPAKAVDNVQSLLREQRVFGFFCNVGSATTAAIAPVLGAANVPQIGGFAVADSARERIRGAAYFLRATSGRELEALVQHVGTIGLKRLAITQLANPGGVEVAALFDATVKAAGLAAGVAVPVKLDGSDAAAAAQALAKAEPQCVFMYLSGTQAGNLMKACHELGFRPSFYGLSIVPGDVTAKVLGEKVRGLAISQVVPYPWSGSDATAIEYRALAEQARQPVNYIGYEGYLNALMLIDALQRCGRDLSHARLHAVMRAYKSRIGGMPLDFTVGSPTGSRFIELVQVRADGRYVR